MKKIKWLMIAIASVLALTGCGETLTQQQADDLADAYSAGAFNFKDEAQRQTERLMADYNARGITPEEYEQETGSREISGEVTGTSSDGQGGTLEWKMNVSFNIFTLSATAKFSCEYSDYHVTFINSEGVTKNAVYDGKQTILIKAYANIWTGEAGFEYTNKNGSGFAVQMDGVSGLSVYNISFKISSSINTSELGGEITLKGYVNNRSIKKSLKWMLY